MTRAERRRHNRELEKRGIGLGWRFTGSGKGKYPVKEPPTRTVEYLEAESARVRTRMGL
jgi:hypothetical protein